MSRQQESKDKLENILFKIVEYGAYVALFSPLIVAKSYFFPFVSPKTIFFRIVVDVIFIAYIILAVLNQKYRPKITPLTITLAAFIAVLFFTSLIGVNFEKSFWSVFERMTGLLTFLHLFVFYIVLVSCFKERKYWERILTVSIFVAVLISFYALLSNEPLAKGGATLGNSSFFMSYLLFNIFFAGILLVWQKSIWRFVYGFALLLFLFILFFSPSGAITQGAVSSLAIGAVLFATLAIFFSGKKRAKILAPAFFISMVLLGAFIVKIYYFQDRPFNLVDIPDRSRQIIWHMGWQAWQEKFWLGWGWENFNIPFAKYYKPELPFAGGDAWYDRVHNVVLDTGVASGIIGLLSYLSIFAVAIFASFKQLNVTQQGRVTLNNVTMKDIVTLPILVPLLLITLLVVYFLQNLWVFDMISSYIMFFMALALIGFLVCPKEEKENLKTLPLPAVAGGFLIVLTIFALFYGNIQPARASRAVLQGLALPLEQSVPAFQKALKLSPISQIEVPERFSSRLGALVLEPNQNPEFVLAGFQSAQEAFQKALLENPKDIRIMMFLAGHYNNFFQITGDARKLSQAEEVLQRALEISPENQQLYWTLTQTKLHQGQFEEAILLTEKALALEPRLFTANAVAVQTALLIGDNELARQKLKEALEINPGWAQQSLTKLIETANIQQ